MLEQLKKYWEIAKIALLQEKMENVQKLNAMGTAEKEFLPAALAVMECPPSRTARVLTYTIAVMFTVFILWACLGKMDIIATATGKLIPAANIKTIQTLVDSEIEEIYVVEGQYVTEGQDLIKFNQTEVIANIDRIKNEMVALKMANTRLFALMSDNPEENFDYEDTTEKDIVKIHKDYFHSQLKQYTSQISVLNGNIEIAKKQKQTIRADIERLNKILPSMQERLEKRRILADQGLMARLTFMEQEEQLTNVQEERNIQLKKEAEAEQTILSAEQELEQYKADFLKKLSEEYTANKEKLISYGHEMTKYQEALKRTLVKAPLSGYVQQLVYHTIGGIIESAKPIMNIVPENYQLEAEVMILNKDIGFVHSKQEVEVKIDSFPFTKYGTIKGEVRNISGDAILDEKLGLVYNSRITLNENKITADGEVIQLKPGMGVTAEIKTGKRRVIEYLLSPVMKYMNESMRER